MGYKKVRICDFCSDDIDSIHKCDVCGQDACSMCGHEMIFLHFFLCKYCMKAAEKHKSEILEMIKKIRKQR
jgi:hypothetical protein